MAEGDIIQANNARIDYLRYTGASLVTEPEACHAIGDFFAVAFYDADDGKGYFLDRHERLTSFALAGITQNKLLTLAPLPWWQQKYAG